MPNYTPCNRQPPFTSVSYALDQLLTTLILFAVFLCGLLHPAFSQGDRSEHDSPYNAGYRVIDVPVENRTVTTAIWYPTRENETIHHYGTSKSSNLGRVAVNGTLAPDREPYPLLFYSHGFGGSGIGYTYLTETLARQGWIVVAPDHQDPVNAVRIRSGWSAGSALKLMNEIQKLAEAIQNPDADRYEYRPQDVRSVMNYVLDLEPFRNRVNRNQLAIGGHSFGGFTALAVCGAVGEPFKPKFNAILLHSPALWMYSQKHLEDLHLPVLYMLGETEAKRERGAKTKRDRAFDTLSAFSGPGYYMEVKEGSHFSFNTSQRPNWLSTKFSGSPKEFDMIRHYSTAFLSHYVLGNEEAKATLKKDVPMRSMFQKTGTVKED